MDLKNLLNEYQYDWSASSALRKKFPKEDLKDKNIVVVSEQGKLANCLLYSLFVINDLHKLNMKIVLVGKDSTVLNQNLKVLMSREDFLFYTIEQLENSIDIVKSDYLIYTGCCNTTIDRTPEFLMREVEFTKRVMNLASAMKIERCLLLSDFRSYGVLKRGKSVSEFEKGKVDFSKSTAFDFELIQTIESICTAYAKQKNFDYVILRTGIILGADTQLDDSIITDLFKAVSKGEEYSIVNSKNKYSFVYISDVLNAVYYSINRLNKNTVYNVVGKKSTVSIGMLVAMMHDISPENTKITLMYSEKDACYGANMNNQKIVAGGCKPKITLEEAIDLILKSEQMEQKPFVFSDLYFGNLKTIQNILLGYMLEVDRICKKHNIKYFLAGGTLLGAIRHNGFIPWDDDADVMMLREDYDKFLKIAQSELPQNIKLQTTDTDSENHSIFAKLRIDDTMFATKWTSRIPKMHNGIFFDVLSHDNTANSNIGKKIHLKATILTRALVFNKWNNREIKNDSKVQSVFSNTLKKMLSLKTSEKLQFKSLEWFKNKKDAKFLYDGMGRNIYKGDFPKEYLSEVIYWDFEGYKFPVPAQYDNYLKYLYGDYNELVIASSRKNSHTIVMSDLGQYADYKSSVKKTIYQDELNAIESIIKDTEKMKNQSRDNEYIDYKLANALIKAVEENNEDME